MADEAKIFGIGAHRTGTTSLMAALRLLGYRTSHWNDREEIESDVADGRYRLTLMERIDAVGDLPIPSLYQQLDKVFPGARFILTIRDTNAWLTSLERHSANRIFEIEERQFYGRPKFDREDCRARFEQHNEEVLDYFTNRPCLLVLDITAGGGWEEICSFLDRKVPNYSFPRYAVGLSEAALAALRH